MVRHVISSNTTAERFRGGLAFCSVFTRRNGTKRHVVKMNLFSCHDWIWNACTPQLIMMEFTTWPESVVRAQMCVALISNTKVSLECELAGKVWLKIKTHCTVGLIRTRYANSLLSTYMYINVYVFVVICGFGAGKCWCLETCTWFESGQKVSCTLSKLSKFSLW